MPISNPKPNDQQVSPDPLPTEIRDHDRSTEGGPPGWMVFSILAGVFVLGVIILIFVFGFGGVGAE